MPDPKRHDQIKQYVSNGFPAPGTLAEEQLRAEPATFLPVTTELGSFDPEWRVTVTVERPDGARMEMSSSHPDSLVETAVWSPVPEMLDEVFAAVRAATHTPTRMGENA